MTFRLKKQVKSHGQTNKKEYYVSIFTVHEDMEGLHNVSLL